MMNEQGIYALLCSEIDAPLSQLRDAAGRVVAALAQPAEANASQQWRPEVVAFADAMESKLRDNDWKGGWKHDASGALMDRVREEMVEVQAAHLAYPRGDEKYKRNLLAEAADVANMLMMVCDVTGALPQSNVHQAKRLSEAAALSWLTLEWLDDKVQEKGCVTGIAGEGPGGAVAHISLPDLLALILAALASTQPSSHGSEQDESVDSLMKLIDEYAYLSGAIYGIDPDARKRVELAIRRRGGEK